MAEMRIHNSGGIVFHRTKEEKEVSKMRKELRNEIDEMRSIKEDMRKELERMRGEHNA